MIMLSISLTAIITGQLSPTLGQQEDMPEATAGNITETIAPQGTTVDVINDTSRLNIPEATAGNITETIAPG